MDEGGQWSGYTNDLEGMLLKIGQAAPVLNFGPEAEEMIGHAISALETISSTFRSVSPAQHNAWSDQIITRMRDNNIVDVSVLVGEQLSHADALLVYS